MAKILLVEDDNNLREIYEARLMAEGYEIVSARDGEEALTVAMKEKPDLIISDVMMPKISGFDMLDILRTTEETKNAKVIMMTALSQAEDKARAEKLGADRYLVKSQVTLEDVAKVAKQVLEGEPAGGAPGELPTPQPAVVAAQMPQPAAPQPPAPAPEPVVPTPVPEPIAPPAPTPDPTTSSIPPVAPTPVAMPVDPVPQQPAPEPIQAAPAVTVAVSDDTDAADDDENEEHKKKVIQPINDLHEDPQAKLDALLEKEKAREEMAQTVHEVVQATQPAVVADPAADVATPDMPVAPPPAPSSNNPDPNSIAL